MCCTREACNDSQCQVFFFQLRQVRRSLDRESAASYTLDDLSRDRADRLLQRTAAALLANAPRTTTDKLQWVLNAAARVITGILGSSTGV